jgi:hypothetical protein
MENRRNYYRILQVQPGAPVEIVRASYRTLMQRLKAHPDLGGDHWNAAVINEAYAVLTDPVRRAQYEREHQAQLRRERAGGPDPSPFATATATTATRCLFCGTAHPAQPNLRANAQCACCGSPLQPASARRLGPSGQRTIERIPRLHPLLLYTTWPQAQGLRAECRDLSLNGILFATACTLAPGSVVQLQGELLRAVAEVTHARTEDAGSGSACLVGARFLSVLFARSRGVFLSARA